jgi:hypothetical protein
MFKWLNGLFKHECCFCDKVREIDQGREFKLVIMACNKCGMEKIIEVEKERK